MNNDCIYYTKKGEKLFNDPELSDSGQISCATCHTQVAGGPYAMIKPTFEK